MLSVLLPQQLLFHEAPAESAHVLYEVDEKAIVERLKMLIDVKEKRETTVQVTGAHIEQVKKYLFMLDLLTDWSGRE